MIEKRLTYKKQSESKKEMKQRGKNFKSFYGKRNILI